MRSGRLHCSQALGLLPHLWSAALTQCTTQRGGVQGVRAAGDRGNPHLYQALGVLAAETGFTDEARRWFSEGTRRLPGAKSSALWHAWAEMEVRSACLPATKACAE